MKYAFLVWWLQDTALFSSATLPQLPRNARYVFHENKCYDWGTFGWVFDEGKINASLYKSIIFMNSSVRGPFLPPYFPVSFHPFIFAYMHLCYILYTIGQTLSELLQCLTCMHAADSLDCTGANC